ncbi:NAD-dependent epimerase/dehydratase family protein [Qipengyuania sp. Mu-71]|jgi:nucleoside-diphosphate-sugar epimerase|uniref:NAD-dependent epimerase/dehydratase family protein n=1 Tax=Qipengyuania sp. Mu-71 TaxID=3121477 RepID=UPI002FE4711A
MKLLLTGSSGWLGRFLAPQLRAAGHEVVGLDIAPGADTQVVGSVADRALVSDLVADGVEAIVHGGALHKPDIARYPKQAFIDTNITGTLNLLEAAARAGHDRFVFTSTTSLMVSDRVRADASTEAFWMDEEFYDGPPRNIYGVTKQAAEGLCRLFAEEHAINIAILRTGRFFPEDDDTDRALAGENMKANEFLNRRLSAADAARAHVVALDGVLGQGCETFVLSAPPPFARTETAELARDARAVIARHFPDAADLYAARGWQLPATITRVYDPAKAQRLLGFSCETSFASVLDALRGERDLPFDHDPAYLPPKEIA